MRSPGAQARDVWPGKPPHGSPQEGQAWAGSAGAGALQTRPASRPPPPPTACTRTPFLLPGQVRPHPSNWAIDCLLRCSRTGPPSSQTVPGWGHPHSDAPGWGHPPRMPQDGPPTQNLTGAQDWVDASSKPRQGVGPSSVSPVVQVKVLSPCSGCSAVGSHGAGQHLGALAWLCGASLVRLRYGHVPRPVGSERPGTLRKTGLGPPYRCLERGLSV